MFIKYSTSEIPPRREEAKVYKEKRLLISLKKMLMYLKSLNMNLLRKGQLVEECITEAKEDEAARQVYVTHARIEIESEPEPTKKKTSSRSTRSVVNQDPPKLEVVDIMQALKERKKTSRRQPGNEGSSEETSVSPGDLDESTVIPATLSEGTDSEYSKEDQGDDEEVDWIDSKEDDKKKYDTDDDKSIDLEMTDDEETDDEVLQGKEQVNDDEDEEMTNAEVKESGNIDEEEDTNAAKENAEKTKEAEDDSKKPELPLIILVSVISEPSVLTLVSETPSAAPITTLPPPYVTTIPPLRVAKLEKDVSELNKIDNFAKALDTLKSQVLTVFKQYLRSKISDDLQKEPVEEPITELVIDDAGEDVVRDYDQPQDTSKPKIARTLNPEWFKQPQKPSTPDLEWNKRQVVLGDRYPIDLSKPLPLQGRPGHLTVVADYFFNYDLEYLKSFDPKRTYTTSITKTKAARYEIVGIEDMVLTLQNTIKHAYDKDVVKGIKH
uniref:Uncharacterized protein n=1 Tax=Tanacetum cinerariifolium TaxID=118510 RepID=A0A699IB06_TANCI|nr:hypothetical protein [Tanacetum cinerariifolium]